MISPELLSAVLGRKITSVDIDGKMILYQTTWINIHTLGKHTINIHELGHMVKEWALKHEWIDTIDMYHWRADYTEVEVTGICGQSGESGCLLHSVTIREPKDMFLYAEWILKEISK